MNQTDPNDKNIPPRFSIRQGGTTASGATRVLLTGHLDADAAPDAADTLRSMLEHGCRDLELDCTNLQFISSTGIGTVVAVVGEYRDLGGEVVLRHLAPGIREIFESLDLLDYVTVR